MIGPFARFGCGYTLVEVGPEPPPADDGKTLWNFIQGLAVFLGLLASVKALTE
ncbi:hypothetical protein SBDP2_1200002 [Syntrophobacter sp. SbD2]|nr:hypothetical protein SBDP2_1200002 [Syntrophobacter sp. SbD2]